MIARDRELLARLTRVNRHLGEVVVELMARQDGGELPADGLRALAEQLGGVVDALRERADELERPVVNALP